MPKTSDIIEPRLPVVSFPRWVPDADSRSMLREVTTNLYVGGALAVLERPRPHERWWGVVDCHGYDPVLQEREATMTLCPRLVRWGFEDGVSIPSGLLAAATDLARSRRGPVLLSCKMGASRSVSVAIAVLRVAEGMSAMESLARARAPGMAPMAATLASAHRWADEESARCRGDAR